MSVKDHRAKSPAAAETIARRRADFSASAIARRSPTGLIPVNDHKSFINDAKSFFKKY
jgi:hypothetical protein